MSTIPTAPGFFTTSGTLLTDQAPSPAGAPAKDVTEQNVTDEVATSTAQQITDAVVLYVSSRLNVGTTGFDVGAKESVLKAVSAALAKKSDGFSPGALPLRDIGGTYQNSIIAAARQPVDSKPPQAELPEASPVTPPTNVDRPQRGRRANNGQGRGRRTRIA